MKKILIIDPADILGGAELFTLDILECLPKENEYFLITTKKNKKYMEKIPKEVSVFSVNIPRLRPFRFFAFLKTLFELQNIVKTISPDVIHTNSVRAGIFGRFLRGKWTHFSHDFTTPKFLAFLFQKADHIFSCSNAVKQDLISKGISGEKIEVVPNGIDGEKFREIKDKKLERGKRKLEENIEKEIQEKNVKTSIHGVSEEKTQETKYVGAISNRPKEKTIIAIVGRIDFWKGQDIFLEAANLLVNPAANCWVNQTQYYFEFRIYGESNSHDPKTQEFENELKKYVEENNLSQQVKFCGFQNIETILSEIDILVHASTEPEPFGRVVIEALAAGVPVIASNLGGTKEILEGELSEFLIEPKNPEILAEKILEFLDEKKREEFKKYAKKRVGDFDLKKILGEIFKVWGRV